MGGLIRKAVIYVTEKTGKFDPTDFLTQDTAAMVWDIVREVLKP